MLHVFTLHIRTLLRFYSNQRQRQRQRRTPYITKQRKTIQAPQKTQAPHQGLASLFLKSTATVMLEKGLVATMNARVIGSGTELLILAHGFGADQSIWDKVVPYLTDKSRILLFDWVFSGAVKDEKLFDPIKYESFTGFADDLIELLEEMGFENEECVFVGHSMSCMAGCIASIKRPELFKKLVLVAGSPRYLNTDDYEGGLKPSEIENILTNIETNFDAWTTFFPTLVIDPADPSSVKKFQACLKRMRPHIAHRVAKTTFLSDERELLDKVITPCAIVQSTNDMVVPMCVAEYMHKRINGETTIDIIECEGHFPMLTSHGRLVEILEKVLGLEQLPAGIAEDEL